MILVPSNLTCELEAEIDFAKEERMERNKDLKNTYFSYGINLTINDLKEVIELIDFFGINLFDENKKEVMASLERITASLLSGDTSFLNMHIREVKDLFQLIEDDLNSKIELLSDNEEKRLNEAFNCYIQELNYSSVIMSVSSIESRLFSLMYTQSANEKLKNLTLGQLIKEYVNDKNTYNNIISRKHEPLLEYCNTYRIFSVHPKEEKITRSNATAILCMTCSFLFDKEMKIS